MKNFKISFVTTYDAGNIHNWSGTAYYMSKALEKQQNELHYIQKLYAPPGLLLRAKYFYYKFLAKKAFDFNREPAIEKNYARQIHALLRPDTDIVFSPGSLPLSLVKTKKPKVFYTDATFAGMLGFYDIFSNFCEETIRHGNYLEQEALDSASMAIYSSDWAAQTAIDHYHADPDKIKVVPFGANIKCDRNLEDIKKIVSNRSLKECHLLFLAVDWNRKGGDMAVKTARKLNEMGLSTCLHIAGVRKLPLFPVPEFVINHGFISKSTQEGNDKISALLAKSHFLILPTMADCSPIVHAEANSFGLPCISTNVGGIPTIINNNVNGMLFSPDDNEILYANCIYSLFKNKEAYRELCLSSYNQFETKLNWDVAGKSLNSLFRQL
jgi:glycosyltransferase involved in cell wall biosynthesis